MLEVGVLLDIKGNPIHWHEPKNRSSVALPDSRELWDVIWERREEVGGFAHSHPGSGPPIPSREDVTTFRAVERALGKRLNWWIITTDQRRMYRWVQDEKAYEYSSMAWIVPGWLDELRWRSYEARAVRS